MNQPTVGHALGNLAEGRMQLAFAGMHLSGGIPGGLVLRGAGEEPHPLQLTLSGPLRQWRGFTPLGEAAFSCQEYRDPAGFTLRLTLGQLLRRSCVFITAALLNQTFESVRLGRIDLLQTEKEGLTIEGNPADWTLSYPYDGCGLNLAAKEFGDEGVRHSFRDFCALACDHGRQAVVAGAVDTNADVDFDWLVCGRSVGLDVRVQMSDVLLNPGQWRQGETVAFVAGAYSEAIGDLYRWIAATHGSRTHRGTILGWCSWYDTFAQVTADHVMALAQAVRQHRDRIPMQVIQIDDGFQRQVGDWECNDSFPDGFAPVIDAIGDAGAMPGVWLAPLAVHETVGGPNYTCKEGRLIDVHPDWFQRDAAGNLVGQAENWSLKSRWLDPTHPEAAKFLRRIIRRMKQEGFSYFKIDFNTLGENVRWHNPEKTRLQAFRDLYQLYRQEMGEDAYLLSCSWLTRGTIGYADASRIGPDSGPDWNKFLKACIRAIGATAYANGVLYACDPDVTYTQPRWEMTQDQHRTWHSFVGLSGGLALVSEPFQRAEYQSNASLRMVEILNPPVTEKGHPLHPGTDPDCRRFGFLAPRLYGDFACVLLYNPDDSPAEYRLDAPITQALGEVFHAWSFWDSSYLGQITHDHPFTL